MTPIDTYKRMKTMKPPYSLEISAVLYVLLMVVVFTIASIS